MDAFRQFFDTTSSTFTYLLIDPATRDAVMIDPVDTHLDEYRRGYCRRQGQPGVRARDACARRSHHLSRAAVPSYRGQGGRAGALRNPACRHPARGRRRAPIRRRAYPRGSHSRSYRRVDVISLARSCLYRRHSAHRRLWPDGLPGRRFIHALRQHARSCSWADERDSAPARGAGRDRRRSKC